MAEASRSDAFPETTGKPVFCLVDQNLKDLIGHHFEYDRACVRGAVAHGFRPVCLGHRDAIEVVAAALPFRRAFSRGMWWTPEGQRSDAAIQEANRVFLAELDDAVADLSLDATSMVFGHMLVDGQLQAWSKFVEGRAGPNGPQVVMLLRYQPHFYRGAGCEAAFRSLERSVAAGARVRLASDSARLSGQLERLTRLPVETFPIPHTSEAHGSDIRAPGPLRVVSLGNARDEKGILELFDAARILELRGDGAGLELVLQVNDPNLEIAPAVERFVADPPANVRLVRSALSTGAYADLLASADIVATPYWRSIYEARTSGVFLEAVAAGKPVICTARTWMSDELAHAGAGVIVEDRDPAALASALVEARDRFAELSAKARADRSKWLAFHNSERLVEVLLNGAPSVPRPAERRVAILFPWGDTLPVPASGAANRLKPVIDLLATRYEKVRVLQDANRAPVEVDGVSYEADPLLERAQAQGWYKRAAKALKLLGVRDGEDIYLLLYLAAGRDAEFQRRLDEIIDWADVVLLEYPFWATEVHKACLHRGKRFTLTAHDVIADQVRSSSLVRALAHRLETRALRTADRRLAISRADARVFAAHGVPAEYSPTGLDVELLRTDVPGDARGLLNAMCGWPLEDRRPILLFMGSKFRPNVVAAEALRRIAARFEQRHGDLAARFVVVGGCWPAEAADNFTALGFVDALTAHLLRRQCALVLAPLTLGTGVSLKSFEALAAGAAILGTAIGLRGVEAASAALFEDDLEAWPDLIADLLSRPERLATLRTAAQALGGAMHYHQTARIYLEADERSETPVIRPDSGDARRRALLLDAAQAAERLGLEDTADTCVAGVLAYAPQDGAALILAARRLAGADSETALIALQDALRQGAEPIQVLRARADILLKRSEPVQAATALAEAARLSVSRRLAVGGEGALRADAWSAYHGGDPGWALALAREIVGGWPTLAAATPDYHYLWAAVLNARPDGGDRVIEAQARLAMAKGFDPFWCWMIIAGALKTRGVGEFERLFPLEQALTAAGLDPDRRRTAMDAMTELAWRRFEAGELVRAKDLADAILARAPDAPGVLYLAAELRQIEAQSPGEALDLFRRAERAGFDAGWCRTHAAELHQALREPRAAVDTALAALDVAGDSHRPAAIAAVCNGLWALYEIGDRDLAGYAKRALDAGLQDGRIWYVRGEALMRSRAFAPAIESYDQSRAAGFDPYWALRRRAEAAAALGLDDVNDRLAAAALARDPAGRVEVLAPLLDRSRGLAPEAVEAVLRACGGALKMQDLSKVSERAVNAVPGPGPLNPGRQRRVDRAWRVFEQGEYEKTLKLGQGLIEGGAPEMQRAHGHYLAAECLQILERDSAVAMRHYDDALSLGFDRYWVHFNRGQLQTKLGDVVGARADLEAAVALASDADRRGKAKESLDRLRGRDG